MKKTLIIILLLTTICQSQTILDPNPLSLTFRSMFSGQDTTGALSYHYFPQNKFTIGWQWGHHPNGLSTPALDFTHPPCLRQPNAAGSNN